MGPFSVAFLMRLKLEDISKSKIDLSLTVEFPSYIGW